MSSLKKSFQKGFTIVELLIVIVVIGILAALVITTYNGIQQKGRNTERQTDLKAVQGQLEAYYAQNGVYPAHSQFGATSATNVTFIQTSMKGLDKEALRDPKGAAGDFSLVAGTTPTATKYAYNVTQDDGSTACTAAAGDCTKYVLASVPEGGGSNIVLNSLN
jgi:prepilin-type N-terminal cleavage/methylation domain-containing protein